jgi:FdhD protein
VGRARKLSGTALSARRLRGQGTDVERILWRGLRERVTPWKFRRQHPIGRHIADFACPAGKLVIELDGGQHAERVAADGERSIEIATHGYRVIRFWNNEVIENLDGVLEIIRRELGDSPTSPDLSAPEGGEEKGGRSAAAIYCDPLSAPLRPIGGERPGEVGHAPDAEAHSSANREFGGSPTSPGLSAPKGGEEKLSQSVPIGVTRRPAFRLKGPAIEQLTATIADEVPVALVYNGLSHAVMMASPTDLEAFALGFSLSEGILGSPEELLDLSLTRSPGGVEVALHITARRFAGLKDRRRSLAGRTGCGLCGVESLAEALRDVPAIRSELTVSRAAIDRALAALAPLQVLNRAAGAVHAAAWADPSGAILALAEDVGRHNALDKLIGRLAVEPRPPGFLVLTSRCSYELVAKAAMRDMPILVAISAPTGLALDLAERVGLTVVALARRDSINVYTHPARVAELSEA